MADLQDSLLMEAANNQKQRPPINTQIPHYRSASLQDVQWQNIKNEHEPVIMIMSRHSTMDEQVSYRRSLGHPTVSLLNVSITQNRHQSKTRHSIQSMTMKPAQTQPTTRVTRNPSVLGVPENFLAIKHDLSLETTREFQMVEHWNSKAKDEGLTLSTFDRMLSNPPDIAHLVLHGRINEGGQFIFSVDSSSAMAVLFNSKFKAFFAAFSRFVEEEILYLIYTSQAMGKSINANHRIFNYPMMRALVENIATRFECHFLFNDGPQNRCIEIHNGKLGQDEHGYLVQAEPPNYLLFQRFYLSAMYHDDDVRAVYQAIHAKYKQLLANRQTVDCCYSWSTLSEAIFRIFNKHAHGIWPWLCNLNHPLQIDLEYESNMNQSYLFDHVYVLSVTPNENSGYFDAEEDSEERQLIDEKNIGLIKRIVNGIRAHHAMQQVESVQVLETSYLQGLLSVSSINDHEPSNTTMSRIIQFRNASTAEMVLQGIIEPLQQSEEYKDCEIIFVPLSEAGGKAHELTGYISRIEERAHVVDGSESDVISQMIKSKLVSKEQCGIKLLILNGCHSYHLAKVFQPFVSSIICIHPQYEIEDEWSVAFTMHFYRNLAKVKVGNELNVLKAFQLTIADLVCRRRLQPERVEEEDEEEYDDDDVKEQDV